MTPLRSAMLHCVMLASCAGCSPVRPEPPPIVVPCPRPVISRELLVPPEHQAMDALANFLGMSPGSAGGTPIALPPSKPN